MRLIGVLPRYKAKVTGIKQRVRGSKFQEHFSQPQLFYNSIQPYERDHLKSAIAFELSHCDDPLVYKKYIEILNNIDFDLAEFVAGKVNGGNPPEQPLQNRDKKSPALSQLYYLPKTPTIASRRVAILVADGFNMDEVRAVRAIFAKEKATTWIIGPRRAMIEADKESGLVADHHFEGQRSTLFDALYIPSGNAKYADTLEKTGRVIHWIREAFGHCKVIGAVGQGKPPLFYI